MPRLVSHPLHPDGRISNSDWWDNRFTMATCENIFSDYFNTEFWLCWKKITDNHYNIIYEPDRVGHCSGRVCNAVLPENHSLSTWPSLSTRTWHFVMDSFMFGNTLSFVQMKMYVALLDHLTLKSSNKGDHITWSKMKNLFLSFLSLNI